MEWQRHVGLDYALIVYMWMKKLALVAIILVLDVSFATPVYKKRPSTGAELTFYHQDFADESELYKSEQKMPKTDRLLKQFAVTFHRLASGTQLQSKTQPFGSARHTSYSVHNHKFNFIFNRDDKVAEINSLPLSVAENYNLLPQFKALYKSGRYLNISPHAKIGGGHIHFGLESTFGNDAILFRNFIADSWNNESLFMGILGNKKKNGPHPLHYENSKKWVENINTVFSGFDKSSEKDIKQLAFDISMNVYIENNFDPENIGNNTYYQVISFKRILDPYTPHLHFPTNEQTIEIRGLDPQQTYQEFYLLSKLFTSRIEYLKNKNTLVPIDITQHNFPALQFFKYVVESGLMWKQYNHFLERTDFRAPPNSDLIYLNQFSWRKQKSVRFFEKIFDSAITANNQQEQWKFNILFNILVDPKHQNEPLNQQWLEKFQQLAQLDTYKDSLWPSHLAKILLEAALETENIQELELNQLNQFLLSKNQFVQWQATKYFPFYARNKNISKTEFLKTATSIIKTTNSADSVFDFILLNRKWSHDQKKNLVKQLESIILEHLKGANDQKSSFKDLDSLIIKHLKQEKLLTSGLELFLTDESDSSNSLLRKLKKVCLKLLAY